MFAVVSHVLLFSRGYSSAMDSSHLKCYFFSLAQKYYDCSSKKKLGVRYELFLSGWGSVGQWLQ